MLKIELKEIKVKDVAKNYVDNEEAGVKGYGGLLNIRPAFQRNFVYKDKQRDEVIRTVKNNFPLNVMYWCINDDGTFELLDGQQRTISLCSYINGDFSIDYQYFHNLTKIEQEQIVSYLNSLNNHVKDLAEINRKTAAECDALKQALLRQIFE